MSKIQVEKFVAPMHIQIILLFYGGGGMEQMQTIALGIVMAGSGLMVNAITLMVIVTCSAT